MKGATALPPPDFCLPFPRHGFIEALRTVRDTESITGGRPPIVTFDPRVAHEQLSRAMLEMGWEKRS